MELTRSARGLLAALGLMFAALPAGAAAPAKPSRPPAKGCAWETLADASVGLAAWVQRCDYGRVSFVRVGQDEPLYDENTLRLVSPAVSAKQP